MVEKKSPATFEQLRGIEKMYPVPLYLYDKKGIRESTAKLKQTFSWSRRYEEYFAVKATLNPFLPSILKNMRCGAGCSSVTKLVMSEACEFTDCDIMFSSNDTPSEEFTHTRKMRTITNLDSITHIKYLEQILGYILEAIGCRYNPGGIFRVNSDIMDNPGDSRYGMTRNQMFQASKTPKAKGAEYLGIHTSLASNTVVNEYYPILTKTPFGLVMDLREGTGAHVSFIDLSGGIDIPYRPSQEPNDVLATDDGARKVYEEALVQAGMDDVAVCTGLGRFIMGPYGALVTRAMHEKHTHKEYMGVGTYVVNLMWPAMYDVYHHITVMGREEVPHDYVYDVVGPLCENSGEFAVNHSLPEIERDDLLFIHGAGARGFAIGYNYNDKLRSAELPLKEGNSVEIIRHAGTPEGYFTTFDFCGVLKCVD